MSVNNANNGGAGANAAHQIPTNTPTQVPETIEKPKEEQKPEVEKKKKWAKREITMLGDDTCGGCHQVEDIINNQIKPNSDVETTYSKIYVDTKEGQTLRKEKNLQFIPFIIECLRPTDPNEKPVCKEYKGLHEYKYKLKVNSPTESD